MTTTASRTASGAPLDLDRFENALTWLVRNAEQDPDGEALRDKDGDGWRTTTWRELADQVARAAGALRALGVGPGDRLVLMLRNRPEFHVVDLAALALRATPISIYNSSSTEQIGYLAGHCRATVAVVEADFLDRVLAARPELPVLQHVVVVDGEGGDSRYEQLLEGEAVDLAAAAEALQPHDLATVIYTSGTTGPPKGVMIDHANVQAQVLSLASLWDVQLPDGERERRLSFLPMAHIAERMTTHYAMLRLQAVVTTCPDLQQLGAYLVACRPHVVFGPPRVWEKLKAGIEAAVSAQGDDAVTRFRGGLQVGARVAELRAVEQPLPDELAAQWSQVDQVFSGIRALVGLDAVVHAITGAAPIPVEVVVFFRALGVPFAEVYGMSENSGAMTLDLDRVKPGTVGRPVPGVEVRLAEDGEVLCRGAIVSQGYLDDPGKTAEAFDADGWLHTGDIGELDDEGYLRLVDRKKELLITAGGKNVSPANLEAALKGVPLVGQACVFGDGKPYLTALLVLDPDAAAAWAAARGREADLGALAQDEDVLAEVAAGVERANAAFSNVERIKRWRVLGEEWLPDSDVLTPTMKLKRRGVRDRYADVIEQLYA